MSHEERTLTPKQVAAAAGVDLRTVQRWCKQGRIPARRIGGSWRIKPFLLAERDPELWEEYQEGRHNKRASLDDDKNDTDRSLLIGAGVERRSSSPLGAHSLIS